jgi:hypothetical protein
VGFEELSQGDDEPPRLNPLALVAIALACVLAGVVVLVFRAPSGPPDPVAGPSPTPQVSLSVAMPSGSASTLLGSPSQKLDLGRICQPVTDGRTSLDVSFYLVNVSTSAVTLMDVEPLLPLAGLRLRGPNRAGGSCEHPGSEAPGGLLAPGGRQLITMRFRLPKTCPQPYPVQARVRLRVNQMVGTTTVPVYADLGAVEFNTCPAPG